MHYSFIQIIILILEAFFLAKLYSYVNGISNYIYYEVWDDITCSSDFIPHLLNRWLLMHAGIKLNPW